MRRFRAILLGSGVCICCALPGYDGTDTPFGSAGTSASGGKTGVSGSGTGAGVAGEGVVAGADSGGGGGGGGDGGTGSGVAGQDGGGVAGQDGGGIGGQAGEGGTLGGAGSGGAMAGSGGAMAGSGGAMAGSGGAMAGSGGAMAGSGGAMAGSANGGSGGTAGGAGTGGSGGVVGCPAGVLGHCDVGATYPTYPGYTLALVEDFAQPLNLNTDPNFTWSDGAPPDGQTSFREEQLSFQGGKLLIKTESPCAPKSTNSGCISPRTSYGEALNPNATSNVAAMGVWSGELRSRYNNFRYGRYEVRLAAPIANPGNQNNDAMAGGFFASLYAYRTPRNLTWAEIDVSLTGGKHASVSTNVVSATNAVGYPTGNASPGDIAGPGGYTVTQEHVYAFTWTPTKIEWFLDGTKIREFTGTASVPIPTVSAKIMINSWVFSGPIFGDPALNKYPYSMAIDYVRFYRWNDEQFYPCSPAPGCLPAPDKTKSSQNNPKETNYGQ